jgi:hypothetical protein
MNVVIVLIAKHAELSLGIMYRICVFQFKLLSICRPRNLVVSTFPIEVSIRHMEVMFMPSVSLTSYQKGAYYAGIKLFSSLPSNKSLRHDIKVLKPELKNYLLSHSFYSVEEFTSIKNS